MELRVQLIFYVCCDNIYRAMLIISEKAKLREMITTASFVNWDQI